MCDYSLENVASRAAAIADRLISTNFRHTSHEALPELEISTRLYAFGRARSSPSIPRRATNIR